MNKHSSDGSSLNPALSRRQIMLSAAGLAALSGPAEAGVFSGQARLPAGKLKPPYDSIRDYVAALDELGLLERFSGVDQDRFDATAIMYALVDNIGLRAAPAIMLEDIRANDRSYPGPIVANLQGNMATEALLLGAEIDPG